jgi:hypothetical protein
MMRTGRNPMSRVAVLLQRLSREKGPTQRLRTIRMMIIPTMITRTMLFQSKVNTGREREGKRGRLLSRESVLRLIWLLWNYNRFTVVTVIVVALMLSVKESENVSVSSRNNKSKNAYVSLSKSVLRLIWLLWSFNRFTVVTVIVVALSAGDRMWMHHQKAGHSWPQQMVLCYPPRLRRHRRILRSPRRSGMSRPSPLFL